MATTSLPAAEQAAESPLQVVLPEECSYSCLTLHDALQPASWQVMSRLGRTYALADNRLHSDRFLHHLGLALEVDREQIYVSVSQKEDGQHEFVSMGEAAEAWAASGGQRQPLSLLSEDVVKGLRASAGAVLLYARPAASTSSLSGQAAKAVKLQHGKPEGQEQAIGGDVVAAPVDNACMVADADTGEQVIWGAPDELCPQKTIFGSNYSVIPELSLGRLQRLILCDEATLKRNLPEEPIFNHLVLIVNCHQPCECPMSKYKVGACSSETPPKVIYQEVHRWNSLEKGQMNQRNDRIQASIWKALQTGTVAVHCLAGIHRAACIVACHFLWRHYRLGHHHIPCDPVIIYECLKAVRPGVSPGYANVLRAFQACLQRQAVQSARAKEQGISK